ncbi:hypothetical protein GPROT1_03684 [Gammaproteobacteria bacterium]|nr:hypothetical protein GPROT1_03684 [Gammaproteobacteria bacterium]
MRLSRADELALRRRLLTLDASIMRLQLQRDLGQLGAAAQPAALMRRAWAATTRERPVLLLLAPLALLAMRSRAALRAVGVLPLLWRTWRSWRR